MKSIIFLGLLSLLIASCGQSKDEAFSVSGPSSCRNFDLLATKALAERKDLSAARQMRDYYLDCVIKDNKDGVVYWGKVAAEIGTEEDRKLYDSIRMTFE